MTIGALASISIELLLLFEFDEVLLLFDELLLRTLVKSRLTDPVEIHINYNTDYRLLRNFI